MRKMADPITRQQALGYYRSGYKHHEVARALGITTTTLRREESIDPDWHDAVQEAMTDAFQPVLTKALKLAMEADAEGENEGALKAMDMVFKHYNKVLDREHDSEQLTRKLEAQPQPGALPGGAMPVLGTPEAVQEYMKQLEAGPPIDVESYEEGELEA